MKEDEKELVQFRKKEKEKLEEKRLLEKMGVVVEGGGEQGMGGAGGGRGGGGRGRGRGRGRGGRGGGGGGRREVFVGKADSLEVTPSDYIVIAPLSSHLHIATGQ